MPAIRVEDRDRLQPELLERQYAISAASPRPRSPPGSRTPRTRAASRAGAGALRRTGAASIDELVGQPRLLGDAARRDQVGQPVRLDIHALDVALVRQPLQVDVRQAEGNTQLVASPRCVTRESSSTASSSRRSRRASISMIRCSLKSARARSRRSATAAPDRAPESDHANSSSAGTKRTRGWRAAKSRKAVSTLFSVASTSQ